MGVHQSKPYTGTVIDKARRSDYEDLFIRARSDTGGLLVTNAATRARTAIAIAIVAFFGLSGCAAPEDIVESVRPAVLGVDPAIRDAYFSTASGPGGTTLGVRLYVDPVDTQQLARIIDGSLKAMHASSPERLASFSLDVAEGDMPSEVELNSGAINIEDAVRELGLYDNYSRNRVSGPVDVLTERYGSWDDLHE